MNLRFYLVTFLFLPLSLVGQNLSGTVFNEYQQALPEVSIFNRSSDHHAHADETGYFIFDHVSIGDTLQFSHTGYETQLEVVTSLQDELAIILKFQDVELDGVVISPIASTVNLTETIDIRTNPVNSSQEILRKVPGLIIGQHAGGGKAEQIFLRGFDIDHGTDIQVTVDGLPVNMVSHAHGQGYADMHFIIPETIERIDFGKGPYYQSKGNFATAGYVDFESKDRLKNSVAKLEAGQFDTYRFMTMVDLLNNNNAGAYLATEYLSSDGPFESPQNFNRLNLFGKYSALLSNSNRITASVSHFDSKWDASGQVPQRAIDAGTITRFGAIDDTEGGSTSRTNATIRFDKNLSEQSTFTNQVYFGKYDFDLFSNFTFFLDDAVNGDQIRQIESRNLYGLSSQYEKNFSTDKVTGNWQAGLNLRNDVSKGNELARTLNRSTTLSQVQSGDINETNVGAFVGASIDGRKWSFIPSVRLDYFDFQYNDALQTAFETQSDNKAIVSPKFNLIYNANNQVQLYLKSGKGFHSNDTRVVVAQQGEKILPAAYGSDLGFIWKPNAKMSFNSALWYLFLEQEFVYVGDAGIVEPSGKTNRKGVDLSYRYNPSSWLSWNIDATYSHARSSEEPEGQDYIPLAPDFSLVSGLSGIHRSGLFGSLNLRYLDDRPANEDNSIVAEGYTVLDFNVGLEKGQFTFGVDVQNLFDVEWNETQFATESRLQNELQPVEEIHFTPGSPFFLKTMVEFRF